MDSKENTEIKFPENFFVNDEFHSDFDYYIETVLESQDVEKPEDLPDDWEETVLLSDREPIITLSADWITDRIDDERFSEEGYEDEKMRKVLNENIDFKKINELLPRLYYGNGKEFKITKQTLIDYTNG